MHRRGKVRTNAALWSALAVVSLTLSFPTLSSAQSALEPEPPLHRNPLSKSPCPDPGAIRVETPSSGGGATVRFYMACTGGGTGSGAFRYLTSKNLVDWVMPNGRLIPPENIGSWSTEEFWAPEIHKVGDRYVMYYSAGNGSGDRVDKCLGAATSALPQGPYADIGRPLLCSGDVGLAGVGFIDAHYFTDDITGRHFLYWKADFGGRSTHIYAIELDPTGLGVVGSVHDLIRNDIDWEVGSVEAPWVIRRGIYYYLFYSGAYYTKTYKVGVARSLTPTGPFTKYGPPILRANSSYRAPGHNSAVHAWGNSYMIYHAYPAGTRRRVPMLDRIAWANDWPRVHNGTPSTTSIDLVP